MRPRNGSEIHKQIEKPDGNEPIVRAMNRLNDVERLVSHKIVARESRVKGWTTKPEALES